MEDRTKNHRFIHNGTGECENRPATKEEIEKGRKKYDDRQFAGVGMRSCYECNSAHAHLMEDFMFRCFSCGRLFVDGVDVMDYKEINN